MKKKFNKGYCAITPDLGDESSIKSYLDNLSSILLGNKIYLDLIIFRNKSLEGCQQADLYAFFEECFWDISQRNGGVKFPHGDGGVIVPQDVKSRHSGLGMFTPVVWNSGSAEDLFTLPRAHVCGGFHFKSNEIFRVKKSQINDFLKHVEEDIWALDEKYIFGCSCHNEADLIRANELELDYCLLSPIKSKNKKFPNIDWSTFSELISRSSIPVFALGGLELSDLKVSKEYGASGIAGISMFT